MYPTPASVLSREFFSSVGPNGGKHRTTAWKEGKRHLQQLIDKYAGEDAEGLVAFLAEVALGKTTIKARAPGVNEDSISYALVPQVPPTIGERMKAAEILLAHRWGKPGSADQMSALPPASETTIDAESAAEVPDYSKLSDDELATLERIHSKSLTATR